MFTVFLLTKNSLNTLLNGKILTSFHFVYEIQSQGDSDEKFVPIQWLVQLSCTSSSIS